jgi:hypothetical protein
MLRKKDERCKLCGTLLLHKKTLTRGICKKCMPDIDDLCEITQTNKKISVKYKMNYANKNH